MLRLWRLSLGGLATLREINFRIEVDWRQHWETVYQTRTPTEVSW